MPQSSKSGKFRPEGIWGKIQFDILPPKGDPEISYKGPLAFVLALVLVFAIPGLPV